MDWKSLFTNWKTTLGGILSAVPPVIVAAGFVLTLSEQHWLALCQGVGALLLGLAAKDASTHSTVRETEIASAKEQDKA
jgi:ABC-type Fe3+ transport system permease subunit